VSRIRYGILACLLAIPAAAQTPRRPITEDRIGSFLAPVVTTTAMYRTVGMLIGVRAGLVIDDRVSVGASSYWLRPERISARFADEAESPQLGYNHFGVDVQYAPDPQRVWSASYGIHLGIGSARWTPPGTAANAWTDFVIAEPSVALERRVDAHARAYVSVGYRALRGVYLRGTGSRELNGPSLAIGLKLFRDRTTD
jgi:hypothetical protein